MPKSTCFFIRFCDWAHEPGLVRGIYVNMEFGGSKFEVCRLTNFQPKNSILNVMCMLQFSEFMLIFFLFSSVLFGYLNELWKVLKIHTTTPGYDRSSHQQVWNPRNNITSLLWTMCFLAIVYCLACWMICMVCLLHL